MDGQMDREVDGLTVGKNITFNFYRYSVCGHVTITV